MVPIIAAAGMLARKAAMLAAQTAINASRVAVREGIRAGAKGSKNILSNITNSINNSDDDSSEDNDLLRSMRKYLIAIPSAILLLIIIIVVIIVILFGDKKDVSGGTGAIPCPSVTPGPSSAPSPSADPCAPSADSCDGKYADDIAKNPLHANFGDPVCDFTKDGLYTLLKNVDPKHANHWFYKVVPCESGYNPNAYNPSSVSSGGAWGLYQMGSRFQSNYPSDRGDVVWQEQTSNAVYTLNVVLGGNGGKYWACW